MSNEIKMCDLDGTFRVELTPNVMAAIIAAVLGTIEQGASVPDSKLCSQGLAFRKDLDAARDALIQACVDQAPNMPRKGEWPEVIDGPQ